MTKEAPEFKSVKASDLIKAIQNAIDTCGDKEIFMQIMYKDKTAIISSIDTIDMRDGGYDKENMKEIFIISNKFEIIGDADYVSL